MAFAREMDEPARMGVERSKPTTTAIVVVDVQTKLVGSMSPEGMAALERAARILLSAARELGAPVLITEQYPAGLGPTVPHLHDMAADAPVIDKLTFSACAEPRFVQALKETGADSAIVLGMETHICVFQTVRDLVSRGVSVNVPLDGVLSRKNDHRQVGLDLCAQAGATITTAETIVFDWLVQAGTGSFRRLSKLVR
jgi:nicotinamidase-related amidase